MNFIKRIFTSRYKELLTSIKRAKMCEEEIRLPDGMVIDFRPGHEYDKHCNSVVPNKSDGQSFIHKYVDRIGEVINIDVYDCFSGDVKLLAVGENRIFVEIVDVCACYSCQTAPTPGAKYWIEDWIIANDKVESRRGFEPSDLPF